MIMRLESSFSLIPEGALEQELHPRMGPTLRPRMIRQRRGQLGNFSSQHIQHREIVLDHVEESGSGTDSI